jgi:hypothetical protein
MSIVRTAEEERARKVPSLSPAELEDAKRLVEQLRAQVAKSRAKLERGLHRQGPRHYGRLLARQQGRLDAIGTAQQRLMGLEHVIARNS